MDQTRSHECHWQELEDSQLSEQDRQGSAVSSCGRILLRSILNFSDWDCKKNGNLFGWEQWLPDGSTWDPDSERGQRLASSPHFWSDWCEAARLRYTNLERISASVGAKKVSKSCRHTSTDHSPFGGQDEPREIVNLVLEDTRLVLILGWREPRGHWVAWRVSRG